MFDENSNTRDFMDDEVLITCGGVPYETEPSEGLNEKDMASAIELFMDNDYWREYYETAPSPACKQRVALEFYYSEYGHDEDFDEQALDKEEERLEALFGRRDWKHMLEYCGNSPLMSKYETMITQYNDDGTEKEAASEAEPIVATGRPLLNPYWNPRTNPKIPGSRF